MAKAKQFIGESYTDSAGKQWRWDGKKYIRNYGASPMASVKRSWDQKIVPLAEKTKTLGQQYASRQERLTKEAIGISPSKDPKSEAVNYFSKLIEDPSIPDQIRYPLEQASLSMQNLFELTNEEDATLSYVNSFKADPPEQPVAPDPSGQRNVQPPAVKKQDTNDNVDDTIKNSRDHYLDEINDPDSIRNLEMNKTKGKWTGEKGDRKLSKPTPIQEKLMKEGNFKDEQLIKLMEKNQQFQADRPKISDLLKIFRK